MISFIYDLKENIDIFDNLKAYSTFDNIYLSTYISDN
jgi:hypothetical protein